MKLFELISRGVNWSMYNPIGRLMIAEVYKDKFGKELMMQSPTEIYKAFFELEKLLNTPE